MASIFSVQNLQTFLRRKNLRPPPGPPEPPGRGPRLGGPPGPELEGPPLGAEDLSGRSGLSGVSSAMISFFFLRRRWARRVQLVFPGALGYRLIRMRCGKA